jgi:hypothetical protein
MVVLTGEETLIHVLVVLHRGKAQAKGQCSAMEVSHRQNTVFIQLILVMVHTQEEEVAYMVVERD